MARIPRSFLVYHALLLMVVGVVLLWWFLRQPVADFVEQELNERALAAQTETTNLASARFRSALDEIQQLSGHPWAGLYWSPSTSPIVLAIAPDAGFAVYWNSHCGSDRRWIAEGRAVSSSDSRVTLRIESHVADLTSRQRVWLDDTALFVRWGTWLCAVPSSQMRVWCAEVSDGRTIPDVPVRVAVGQERNCGVLDHRPTELPEVPLEFASLILAREIHGTVLALANWRSRDLGIFGPDAFCDAVFLVDVGSAQGLVASMHVFTDGSGTEELSPGVVTRVFKDSALVERVFAADSKRGAESIIGRTVSTRRP